MTVATQIARGFRTTWRAIASDFGALTLLFGGGLIYSFFYPLPYRGESVRAVPVAVVDQDGSGLSRQITRLVDAHPLVEVRSVTVDPIEARQLLWKGAIAGFLTLPRGMQATVLAGRSVEVEVAGNGLYMLLNKAALTGMAEAVGAVSAGVELKRLARSAPLPAQALAAREPLHLNTVAVYNVREGYGSYLVPGVAVLIVQQTLLIAIALMIGTWVERGSAPFEPSTGSFLGVLLAFTSVGFLNSLYFGGFVMWAHGYGRGGNPGGLLAFALLYALAVASLGMLIGLRFRTRERSVQLLLATAIPALFLSGLPWPAEALPAPLRLLRWAIPSTAGIEGQIALNQMGAGLAEVGPEILVLFLILLGSSARGLARWKEHPLTRQSGASR